ncbi:MAG: class I SAM-dependent methyltransferase [Actinoallomurus sp.]
MRVVNTAQAEAWNGYEGGHWAAHQSRYDAVNSGFNEQVLAAAAVGEHDRVLDVGCGNGQLTRLAARRAGHATGVDLSGPMLDRARASAAEEGVANATFEQADAQIHPFTASAFDVAMSRFGVMFFADPVRAFANIAYALRPGGRVAFLSLRDLAGSDLGTAFAALRRRLPARPASAPGGPGPESLSDPDHIRGVLAEAGFAEVAPVAAEAEAVWGRDAEDAAEFLGGWGPVRHVLDQVDADTAAGARADLTEAMRSFESDGAVRLRGAAWLTTAIRP